MDWDMKITIGVLIVQEFPVDIGLGRHELTLALVSRGILTALSYSLFEFL